MLSVYDTVNYIASVFRNWWINTMEKTMIWIIFGKKKSDINNFIYSILWYNSKDNIWLQWAAYFIISDSINHNSHNFWPVCVKDNENKTFIKYVWFCLRSSVLLQLIRLMKSKVRSANKEIIHPSTITKYK